MAENTVDEEDLQYFIGFFGWVTAQRLFNGSDLSISITEMVKLYKLQCAIDKFKHTDDNYVKELGRVLIRRGLLKFEKREDDVYLKLALPEDYVTTQKQ